MDDPQGKRKLTSPLGDDAPAAQRQCLDGPEGQCAGENPFDRLPDEMVLAIIDASPWHTLPIQALVCHRFKALGLLPKLQKERDIRTALRAGARLNTKSLADARLNIKRLDTLVDDLDEQNDQEIAKKQARHDQEIAKKQARHDRKIDKILLHCQSIRDSVLDDDEMDTRVRMYGFPTYSWRMCANAALEGDLRQLQWLREQGSPWNDLTCKCAAENGHLEVLQWARDNGCPWDLRTYKSAEESGNEQIMAYTIANGCPEAADQFRLLGSITRKAFSILWMCVHCEEVNLHPATTCKTCLSDRPKAIE
jgi:hypothetical protein